jgi:hypothetical protein
LAFAEKVPKQHQMLERFVVRRLGLPIRGSPESQVDIARPRLHLRTIEKQQNGSFSSGYVAIRNSPASDKGYNLRRKAIWIVGLDFPLLLHLISYLRKYRVLDYQF